MVKLKYALISSTNTNRIILTYKESIFNYLCKIRKYPEITPSTSWKENTKFWLIKKKLSNSNAHKKTICKLSKTNSKNKEFKKKIKFNSKLDNCLPNNFNKKKLWTAHFQNYLIFYSKKHYKISTIIALIMEMTKLSTYHLRLHLLK